MTVSYSIRGKQKTAQEMCEIVLVNEAIVTSCNSARKRVREQIKH